MPNFIRSPVPTDRPPANVDEMVSQFVRTLHEDRNGDLWLGTNGDGVIHVADDTLVAHRLIDTFGGVAVYEVVEDERGLWFATSYGVKHHRAGVWTTYGTERGLTDDQVWSIARDTAGTIWAGTGTGVARLIGNNFEPFAVPRPDLPDTRPHLGYERVAALTVLRDGTVWIAFDGQGITVYRNGAFTFLTTAEGLPDNHVADLRQTTNGDVWIGTMYGGITRFDGHTFHNYMAAGRLPGVEAYNIQEDRAGNVWFNVEHEGVFRFDGTDFHALHEQTELPLGGVQSLYPDSQGTLWMATWFGLFGYQGGIFFRARDRGMRLR